MHLIIFVVKRLVMAICMLYTFDLIVMSAGIIVPINVPTIILVSILGLPAIFGLLILQNIL